jgi:hypothetical protein
MKALKYNPGMTLREAGLVARYGAIARKSLARAALLLWPCELELKAAEAAAAEIIKDIDELRHTEAFARKQLFRFTAGLDPTFIRNRARLLKSVTELLAKYSLALSSAEKRRKLAKELHDRAKTEYDREHANADRKVRYGMKELRARYDSGEIDDPLALRLIELTKRVVLSDKLRPEIDDHETFEVIIRPQTGYRFRAPWMIDMMPLSDPAFQERLTVRQLVSKSRDIQGSRIADKYRRLAKALGWRLAPEPEKEEVGARYCECGEPLEKHKRLCEVCRFHSQPSGLSKSIPIDYMPAFIGGRPLESAWRYGEYREVVFGHRNQGTRDFEDIMTAHREGKEAYGAANWKEVKCALESELPYHQDLGDSGRGQK